MPGTTGGKMGMPADCPLPAGWGRHRRRPDSAGGAGGDGAPRLWAHGPNTGGSVPWAQERAASADAPANVIVPVNAATKTGSIKPNPPKEPSRREGKPMDAEHEHRDLYRSLVEHVPIGLYVVRTGGPIIEANPALLEMLGYPDRETLLATPLDSFFVDREAMRRWQERIDRDGTVAGFEIEVRRYDGSTLWVSHSSRLQCDARGGPLFYEGSLQDITARRAAEHRLRFTQFAIDHAAEAAFWVNRDTTIAYVNQAASRLLGYSREELQSMRIADIAPDFPVGKWDDHWRSLQATGSRTFVSRHQAKDGHTVPVEITANHMEFEGTEYHCTFVRDITERIEANEQRRRFEQHLRQSQKMEAVGQLAGGLAHEVNNQLTVIVNCADFLRDGLKGQPEAQTDLDILTRAGDRCRDVVQQVLAFSRRQTLTPRVVALPAMLPHMRDMLRRLLPESIQVSVSIPDDTWEVRLDAAQVEQAVLNLALNSRDAMPEGGSFALAVRNTTLSRKNTPSAAGPDVPTPGRYVLFEVADTGVGMADGVRTRAFEPFFTTKGRAQASGLGLSTAYGIIKQHGGFMTVESEPDHGTMLRLYLPAEDRAHRATTVSDPMHYPPVKGASVAVAEDDDDVRRMMTMILRRAGHDVIDAPAGESALRTIAGRVETIDVLVTDVVMPGISGKKLAAKLREAKPELKVVFGSGYPEEQVLPGGVTGPDTTFIPKPFTAQGLTRAVQEVLEGR